MAALWQTSRISWLNGTQDGALGHQFPAGPWRCGASYLLQHPRVGGGAGIGQHALVVFRQAVELFQVEESVNSRAAFPPCRIVVVLRHLVEAELLVVIRTDEFGGVDRALFQCRVDVAAGNLLRRDANLSHHLAGEAGNAHLQALEIIDGVDFLAEPAAHLGAGVAGRKRVEVVAGQEFVDQLVAAAGGEPGIGHGGH